MRVVRAGVPLGSPPAWAILERRLFDLLDDAWRLFETRYCRPDGGLIFTGKGESRDGADDFYETFFNWPALYQLGGSDDLLAASKQHWTGVTRQLARLGYLVDEYERGYDWFHQGESMLLFYGICAADPADQAFRDRAHRFAELYLPGSPAANYDPVTNTIRAPHNGAGGPRWGVNEEWASYGADLDSMRPYGLPLRDVKGIGGWDDLARPEAAAAMGAAMNARLGSGDVAINLASTSLAVNAWLYDHDSSFSDWALRYIDGWRERAARLGGILPDNVGPSGQVGELHGGRWYGGSYGWTWPHGIYSVGTAAVVAAVNALLLTGDPARLEIGRIPLDMVLPDAAVGAVTRTEMTNKPRWLAQLGDEADKPVLLVPNRRDDEGWFDYQPPQLALPAWLWHAGQLPGDADRLAMLRERSGYDWSAVREFRDKEEAGHEAPWLAFLAGDNPGYPELILRQAMAQVGRRLALIERDHADPSGLHFHHWQWHNPVVTEALTQLITGSPQVLYNGGLPVTQLGYYDAARRRPGLPPGVAALVDRVTAEQVRVQLVNLQIAERRVLVRAGGFGEHDIDRLTATVAGDGYPGDMREYHAPPVPVSRQEAEGTGGCVEVVLPPLSRIELDLYLNRWVRHPAHGTPWEVTP
jgi:hypothetical protein